jgi:hypothetical protein
MIASLGHARRYLAGASLLALWPISIAANADGALVVGVPDGGLRHGFAYGRAIGGTETEVTQRAFRICREQAQKQGFDVGKCILHAVFRGGCVAVAMDIDERWAGWAVFVDRAGAERAALDNCAEGANGCRIHSLDCDQ